MTLRHCTIKFDNRPNGIFYSGETVTGTINLELTKHKSCQALMLKISGIAKCKWVESRGSGKNRHSTRFVGEETYFETNNNLLSEQHANHGKCDMVAGNYSFRFACDLPPKLPSSLEELHGHVRYIVKVTMKRSYKIDLSHKILFTVLSQTDLNLIPGIYLPVKIEASKMFYFLFFQKGKLFLTIQIPFSGYVPGQPLFITSTLKNESSVHINNVTVNLMKRITYTSKRPYTKIRHNKVKITSCIIDGVGVNDETTTNKMMPIPAIPPSILGTSSVIDVSYELDVIADASGFHTDLSCRIPITIGTIPISNHLNPLRPQLNQPSTSTSTSPTAPPIAYSELPPPTYEEAMASSTDKKEDSESDDDGGFKNFDPYKPKYPMYDFKALK